MVALILEFLNCIQNLEYLNVLTTTILLLLVDVSKVGLVVDQLDSTTPIVGLSRRGRDAILEL